MTIEEKNLDVLQNIEWSIVGVYKSHPQLTDYQVDAALEALGRTYQHEKTGGEPVLPKNPLAKTVYEAVRQICEWRLGREQAVDEEGQPMSIKPLTIDEIQDCLKRIRKSVNYWNKQSGTTGYLEYITKFVR